MKKTIAIFLFLINFCLNKSNAQFGPPKGEPDIINKQWQAQWISVPNAPNDGYGVYMFRKLIDFSEKPSKYIIHISADNRYKLFINQKLVSLGPARGDLAHWNYETVDIAAYLKTGKNIIAAQVWNEGEFKQEAQISYRTGFILQGNTLAEKDVNTNNTWLCEQDNSFAPLEFKSTTFYVAGPGEIRNMALSTKNWIRESFDDKSWQKAKLIGEGIPKNVLGAYGTMPGWMLVPSILPQMELKDERMAKTVSMEGIDSLPVDFPAKISDLLIPANSKVNIILDHSYLTNAFPNLEFSGGKNATISLRYAEALFTKDSKGNRNDTKGKTFIGRADSLISDGSNNQKFTSLAYRTYRYLQITVITQNEAITLNDIYGTFIGYPFRMNAQLAANNPEMDKILEIGWRTARLCANETYMDCPYYEQLQYIGDGRIQALVSLFNSGDDRLVKNAINLMDFSRTPEGVTLSRHPSYTPQFIPTFSLWYIGMLQDYARYGADIEFIKSKISGSRQILSYFKSYQQADGRLKNTPQWMFTDWVDNQKEWNAGIGPTSANGTSAVLDLQLLWAYQVAADLETKLSNAAFAKRYASEIATLKKIIRVKYWDISKQLFADREEKDEFSQHTNSLAILTGLATASEATQIANQLIANDKLTPASIYFKYYLHQALIKAGKGNDYLNWLDKWRENINMGLTTWAETSDVDKTRSDCHAWGSSPNIEFYRTILGIDSDGLAFSKVKIEPHLGQLKDISGSIPHPKGNISASYKLENGKWKIRIELPKTITGKLAWKGKTIALKEGVNQFNI
jgi:alpha-L-rhamnosidase